MQSRTDLIGTSLAALRSGQSPTGAFLACPAFAVYRYCWFRDGTFIAQALDLWGDHAAARRFYDWGTAVVVRHIDIIRAAVNTPIGSVPQSCLHTRYRVDGTAGDDDWPNFQLDGFGTFLWGMVEHLRRAKAHSVPGPWEEAISLLAAYLARLWRSPNADCWEEYPNEIHISTLCAIYGGLVAVADYFQRPDYRESAEAVRAFILAHPTPGGYLPKFIGSQDVDASLLWAALPYRLLDLDHPLMSRTVARIEADLVAPDGGLHRYARDTYYGGGLWILLTATLGEVMLARGEVQRAASIVEWIEEHASPAGELPEQLPSDLNAPEAYDVWIRRWGPIASPLLWSHAAYLRLKHAMLTE